MTPRTLFNIILKIFGLFFLREIINTLPSVVVSIWSFTREDQAREGLFLFIFNIVMIIFYAILVYNLIFNTNYILDKSKLDQGFNEAEFSLHISPSLVITIALIVLGGIMLIIEIPNLCQRLFLYFEEKRLTYGTTKPDISYSIISGVKILIALLLIGERKRIVDFIDSRQKKKAED